MKYSFLLILVISLFSSSCEPDQIRKNKLAQEEQQTRIKEKAEADNLEKTRLNRERVAEAERRESEAEFEKDRKEKEIYDYYINNSLQTSATPYSKYYGGNSSCSDFGCSQIKVKTSNSDVLVTIKKNDRVVRHAFIQSGDSYSFSFPNGTYQAFFYYGTGWNPEKEMKGGKIKGGFIANEDFGKDDPQKLYNNILEYELILQQNGNFSTRPSNAEEAL